MAAQPETIRGTLSLDLYAPGSKSEHRAVILTTASGDRLVARRLGANPYDDPQMAALAGTTIEATGRRHRDILLIYQYTVLIEPPSVEYDDTTVPPDRDGDSDRAESANPAAVTPASSTTESPSRRRDAPGELPPSAPRGSQRRPRPAP
jgi:hypothetical protein